MPSSGQKVTRIVVMKVVMAVLAVVAVFAAVVASVTGGHDVQRSVHSRFESPRPLFSGGYLLVVIAFQAESI